MDEMDAMSFVEGFDEELKRNRELTEINKELCDALEWAIEISASYFNICPDRHGRHLKCLEGARAALAKARGEAQS